MQTDSNLDSPLPPTEGAQSLEPSPNPETEPRSELAAPPEPAAPPESPAPPADIVPVAELALPEPPEPQSAPELHEAEQTLPPPPEFIPSTPEFSSGTSAPQGEADSEPSESEEESERGAESAESEPAAEGTDRLADLAARSQLARLSGPEEDEMGVLLREALLGGKPGLARAVENLPKLPWIVGVRAVEGAWTEMKITARAQLLKGLADNESDSARRVRLSLARALFKLDPATGLKLALGVCKEFRDKETGSLTQKQAQIFANVLIGKVKPWLAQINLADLKPADADLLVHCALLAVFTLPHPPVTQLGVLKWAGEASRLGKLHESALAAIGRGLSRFSAKWQNAVRKEVANLPEEISSLLKPVEATPEVAPATESALEPGEAAVEPSEPVTEGGELPVETPRKPRPVYEPRPQKPVVVGENTREGRREGRRDERREDREERREERPREEREERRDDREERKERPVYQSRGTFNLSESLRQIETHVQALRTELSTAQNKLRTREEDVRKERRPEKEKAIVIVGEPTPDELARLNVQLENRITELQSRIDELGSDAEDRAASMGAHNAEQVTDKDQQLRTLLGFKLQEDFADYLALQDESTSVVVQQHYRTLIQHIFEVLKTEGVEFKE